MERGVGGAGGPGAAQSRPTSPTFGALALALWRLSRPEAWMVSVLPMLGGWVMASHELVPGLATWGAFWDQASHGGATSGQFWDAARTWWPQAWPLLLAAL